LRLELIKMAEVLEGENDELIIKPLGAGQEVGRSCILIQFKGKSILLDCGIHPGLNGVDALPFVDTIDCEKVDLLLVTHFHLDHCGGLPWFLEKTTFRGRCFMTHATKAIYPIILSDYVKVSNIGLDQMLYSEDELEKSMDKIELIDFHEQKEVNGIKFWCYVAGHVLGACMFMIEIAGVRILYTGDYSRLEDRHLCAAEVPSIRPDVLIAESTYGTQIHENREDREHRFTSMVYTIVSRGGRCLIPVFALGRAQELLLILDEFWTKHSELQNIPIFFASSLAKKCMAVYQTFISGMNQNIQKQIAVQNPFLFKHVRSLRSIDFFEDIGPCVVLASPGMLQSGLSRELFEMWCTDVKNGCIIAGYCVEGTLAKHILSEPKEIVGLNGAKLSLRMQVAYVSFSAHADYKQTSEFIRRLKPPNLVFVHGEATEMIRLKAAIMREYEDDPTCMQSFSPRNTEPVSLHFRGEKTTKVIGQMATKKAEQGDVVSGVMIKRNFDYHLMHSNDVSGYTDLSKGNILQTESVFFNGHLTLLNYFFNEVTAGKLEILEEYKDGEGKLLRAFKVITIRVKIPVVQIEWFSSPVNDMYADTIVTAVLEAQTGQIALADIPVLSIDGDLKQQYKVFVTDMLIDMFGQGALVEQKCATGSKLQVKADEAIAVVDLDEKTVECNNDDVHRLISNVLKRCTPQNWKK
ncbi:Cleavage and polyadenylation specificity factor subunit 3, partial [Trichinella pseudospiralis]